MLHKLFAASCISAIAAVAAAAPAYAVPNSHNNSCQTVETGMPTATYGGAIGNTPGNAATSPGSVFNEPGINSLDGGKGGLSYNKPHGASTTGGIAQYDTACANTLKTGTGTPIQGTPTNPAPISGDFANNSRATRPISHQGNGATK